jgi:hypothetical protein
MAAAEAQAGLTRLTMIVIVAMHVVGVEVQRQLGRCRPVGSVVAFTLKQLGDVKQVSAHQQKNMQRCVAFMVKMT